ncbi:MAG: 23S rRNA (pseudouridine(1915)-N(3))-methyltransferase RlmH [Saprospiraceae bacterium]
MKIEFSVVGKTNESYLREGCTIFEKRLKHYNPFEVVYIPDIKNAGKLSPSQLKQKEGETILNRLQSDDYLVLLDEKGKIFTSEQFAKQLDKLLQSGGRRIVFQIGGAFGFSEDVYKRANQKIALSQMTFSHQMVRLFFLEQLYRGFSILRNEKYHNR